MGSLPRNGGTEVTARPYFWRVAGDQGGICCERVSQRAVCEFVQDGNFAFRLAKA